MIFKSKKKKLSEECWDLRETFIKWLNTHLKVYLKEADKVIDLEFKKFEYNGKTYTQKQLIYEMIDISEKLLDYIKYDYSWEEEYQMQEKLLDLFRLVFYDIWW